MLKGKKIAAIITDGYHNTELSDPMNALVKQGAEVVVIGIKPEHLTQGLLDHETLKCPEKLPAEKRIKAHKLINEVKSEEFDGLLLPGGYSPEKLRLFPEVISFIQGVFADNKPIAAICHGPQILISADIIKGRKMTCVPTIAVDIKNAGAVYLDRPLVVDNNFITSRTPKDMEYFIKGFIKALEN